MKALIFGGSGFIGENLANHLKNNNYEVFIVTRNKQNAKNKTDNKFLFVEWDYNSPLTFIKEKFDIVINLAGKSIGKKRWTKSVRREIYESRINSTQKIVQAINDNVLNPKVFINASAIGYYGKRQNEIITESSEPGNDFLAKLCIDWEKEAYKISSESTRVITMRTAVVLGEEGALQKMMIPFKFFVGGPIGNGKQYLSWIHISDLVNLILFMIENPKIKGPVNASAPNPVTNKKFSKTLAKVINRPYWLPIPAFVLKIVLGKMSEMLLHGQNAIPEKASKAGFKFQFPSLREALRDLLNKCIHC